MKTVAIVFARGGSKGLPGKNIRQLGGKPLIAWSIEHALAVERIGQVIVSTDSEEIAAVARDFGADVPFMRPAELSMDSSPEWLAWRHALGFILETTGALPDVMVSVPTTAPLRLPLDIENCLDEFEKGGADIVISVTDAHRSPYFNMVFSDNKGYSSLVINPHKEIARRQDAPKVFDMTTVAYIVDPKFVKKFDGIFEGRVKSVIIPPERAIDIDTMLDFKITECLFLEQGK